MCSPSKYAPNEILDFSAPHEKSSHGDQTPTQISALIITRFFALQTFAPGTEN